MKFHDGADLDANDVVVSYAVQWDTKHPLHIGRSGAFDYFPGLWGGFLNPPAELADRPAIDHNPAGVAIGGAPVVYLAATREG